MSEPVFARSSHQRICLVLAHGLIGCTNFGSRHATFVWLPCSEWTRLVFTTLLTRVSTENLEDGLALRAAFKFFRLRAQFDGAISIEVDEAAVLHPSKLDLVFQNRVNWV